jgi:uncharacterized repeat protein (TIGR04076 family)
MRYEVTIEVEDVVGGCSAGHKVGDKWKTKSPDTPLSICPVALVAIWQKIYAMLLGADFWWANNPNVAFFSCPDAGKVKFKISRTRIDSDKQPRNQE